MVGGIQSVAYSIENLRAERWYAFPLTYPFVSFILVFAVNSPYTRTTDILRLSHFPNISRHDNKSCTIVWTIPTSSNHPDGQVSHPQWRMYIHAEYSTIDKGHQLEVALRISINQSSTTLSACWPILANMAYDRFLLSSQSFSKHPGRRHNSSPRQEGKQLVSVLRFFSFKDTIVENASCR